MPGPKMGPRPPDFDEALVRQSPTFQKWAGLPQGAKLKYACREFTKGHGQDEERLMRRIMIARRNNLKDHATLKKARALVVDKISSTSTCQPGTTKKRRTTPSSGGGAALSDAQVTKEMDVVAVEATRSYRKWQTLQDGEEFLYNQKYTKGKEGHDWLLRKNIWRRMRYRRENKKMVQSIQGTVAAAAAADHVNEEGEDEVTAAGIVDHALLAANASATSAVEQAQLNAAVAHDAAVVQHHENHDDDDDDEDGFAVNKAVEAAVAAAEQYVKAESINMAAAGVSTTDVHNPLEGTTATDEALDAAARLAAASTTVESDDAVAKLAAEAVAGGDETDVVQI